MKLLALIPAREGSERVPHKNIRYLNGHPLIAYSITSALQSKLFDRIVVSTDSTLIAKIALYYGADVPFIRPHKMATSISQDVEWIKHALANLEEKYDVYSILRPTSPFRSKFTIIRGWGEFIGKPKKDSLRAIHLCHEHPGKMWVMKNGLLKTLLAQSHLKAPWHAGQYQALPKVYVQNSSLEFSWTEVVRKYNSREGKKIAPFFTDKIEGFSIDSEDDWERANYWLKLKKAVLPKITQKPYQVLKKVV